VREGFVVARIAGAQTNTLQVTQFRQWSRGNWSGGLTARLRCSITRPHTFLVTSPATLSVCPTDLDCSQGVDGDDVILFFGLWDSSDPRADVTGDGGVDGDDVIAFFRNFDEGC
jgi:hypothetical protein